MRILSTVATVAFLAATPAMAQVVITTPAPAAPSDTVRHAYNANRQENAAQRDDYKARQDAASGDYRAAAHEQDKAQDHQDAAQHQEHRAAQDMSQ